MNDIRNTIIIGSGPSGHTAALYTARANLSPLVLEGNEPGGQLTTTTDVENFPGFPKGILGPELMQNMKEQALRFGAEYKSDTVKSVDFSSTPKKIITENGDEYFAKTVVVSTGASARYLGIPGEKELIGKGVSGCATCDGFFYREKEVAIVGGGDTAIEEAMFLTRFASKVYILHRRDVLRASKPMQQKAFDNPKIEIKWNVVVDELKSDSTGLTGVVLKDTKSGELNDLKIDGLFMGIGHTPNTKFLNGSLDLDENGFIKTTNDVETSVHGVFSCGDVRDPYYRQAITAAGTGCMAAIRVERGLEEA